jgi:hypothetical protein
MIVTILIRAHGDIIAFSSVYMYHGFFASDTDFIYTCYICIRILELFLTFLAHRNFCGLYCNHPPL